MKNDNKIYYPFFYLIAVKNISSKEQELIEELKHDSCKAFNGIYYLYAKRLYGYCLQYTQSAEDAEEIVQDVFIRLWNYRRKIKQNDTLRNLLFVMAKHHLINAYRSRINSPIYEDYIKYTDTLGIEETDKRLEYDEFLREVQQALTTLPTTQQKIIRMSKLELLPNKVIAERLALSEQTVKNQLSIGLKTLKKKFNKLWWLPILLFIN